MTAERALEQILVGTGVRYRLSAPRTVALDVAPVSESVDVTGRTAGRALVAEIQRAAPRCASDDQVIPRAIIEAQGAGTLRDVLRNVPGITMQAGEGRRPAGDNLSIRGFSARTDIFIDGVRDFGGYSRDSFNLEQVEVVKGPVVGHSGRGSTGGSINLVTQGADLDARRAIVRWPAAARTTSAARSTSTSRSMPIAGHGDAPERDVAGRRVPGRDVVENRAGASRRRSRSASARPTRSR